MATILRKKYQREKVQNIHDENGHGIVAFWHILVKRINLSF